MTKNMGITDRIIRTIIALIFGVMVITGKTSGIWTIILGALAIILLLTSAIGWCPLYQPFRFSTKRTK
ncbi:MAG: YgaP-like transmembrane domain [Nitrospirota bacterium]